MLVAFLIFIGLISKKAWNFITTNLDARADRVRDELEDAAGLREEAQTLLANYQRDHRGVEAEVAEMLAGAHQEARRITSLAQDKLAAQLTQKEAQAEQNIEHAEIQAIEDIREAAAALTIAASYELIHESLDSEKASRLMDISIDEVSEKLAAS